ncbi:unnamed protein product [Gongylonema pulchrum]|uniref:GED domain-containing protein n=1 Tax=Gongylonema pulchrum TaxID=637853 RepID=A0A183ET33_9BILA|nr:unnamed protein product [Gongylonema pulchrum]
MMQKAVNTIFYVAAKPSLCCRLIASGLVHEMKRCLAQYFLAKREIEGIEPINFDKETFKDCSEAEDEDQPDDEPPAAGLVSESCLVKMKEEVMDLLNKDKEQCMTVWETVAERVCAFAGQVALKTLIHIDVSFVLEMKRKNELLHIIKSLSDEDRAKLEGVNYIEEFPTTREPTTLEAESMERQGFFEVNEQEEGDRLGLTGLVFHFTKFAACVFIR